MKKAKTNILIYVFIIVIIICGIILYFINKPKNNEKNLLFTVKSTTLKCPSPVLKVYDDNTYELFDNIVIGDGDATSKKGNYNYDVSKILDNAKNYKIKDYSSYSLTDSNNDSYYIDDNYTFLTDFLTLLNVDLHRCSGVN